LCWVGNRLVALCHLDEDRLWTPRSEWPTLEVRRVGDRIRGLLGPFIAIDVLLDRDRARNGIDHLRLVAKGQVRVEVGSAQIDQRRSPRGQECPDEGLVDAQPAIVDQRSPRFVEDSSLEGGIKRDDRDPVVGSKGPTDEVYPRLVEVNRPIA